MAKSLKRTEFDGEETERIALVKLLLDKDEAAAMASLSELELLCQTAGGVVGARFTQAKDKPDPATYIGSGKVKEIADFCRKSDGKEFLHVNTHLDYTTKLEEEATQVAQIDVLLEEIAKFSSILKI